MPEKGAEMSETVVVPQESCRVIAHEGRSGNCPGWRRHAQGLALVDVVIALLILAVMVSVAAPGWRGALERYRVQVAAERLGWQLRLLQAEAITRGETTVASFDTGANEYSLLPLVDPRTRQQPWRVRLSRESPHVALVATEFPDNELEFGNTGLPSSSGAVILESAHWQVRVTVRPSGMIQVEEPEPVEKDVKGPEQTVAPPRTVGTGFAGTSSSSVF